MRCEIDSSWEDLHETGRRSTATDNRHRDSGGPVASDTGRHGRALPMPHRGRHGLYGYPGPVHTLYASVSRRRDHTAWTGRWAASGIYVTSPFYVRPDSTRDSIDTGSVLCSTSNGVHTLRRRRYVHVLLTRSQSIEPIHHSLYSGRPFIPSHSSTAGYHCSTIDAAAAIILIREQALQTSTAGATSRDWLVWAIRLVERVDCCNNLSIAVTAWSEPQV